jgi:hypothetical protein
MRASGMDNHNISHLKQRIKSVCCPNHFWVDFLKSPRALAANDFGFFFLSTPVSPRKTMSDKRASRAATKKAQAAPTGQANITAFMTPRIAPGDTLPQVRGRGKRTATVEKKEANASDEEDSDELVDTPYEQRPPSPTRPRSRNSSPQKSRPVETEPLPEEPIPSDHSTAALDTTISDSAQDDEIAGLASKYDKYVFLKNIPPF